MRTIKVNIKETSPGSWRVTFNGHVLGDSRGYRKDEAIAKARQYNGRVDGEWRNGVWIDAAERFECEV
jgi:hypothetical protein